MADRSEHASRTDQSGLHSHIGLIPPDKSAGACAGTCPYHRQTGHNPKTSNGRVGDNPTGTWKQASHPQLNERFARYRQLRSVGALSNGWFRAIGIRQT
jgi:hypothetical protein